MRIKQICIIALATIVPMLGMSSAANGASSSIIEGGGTIIQDGCLGSCRITTTYTAVGGTKCATSNTEGCYGTQKLISCQTCPSNYTLTSKTMQLSSNCSESYNTCELGDPSAACDGTCTNCTSTDWGSVNLFTGVQTRTVKTCDTSTCICTSSTEYRCGAGYYGYLDNCTACPGSGTSTAGSNGAITDCYLPAGTTGSDATGTYEYTTPCYYTE